MRRSDIRVLCQGVVIRVMEVRNRYSIGMKKTDMGLLQPQRTYAITGSIKNWHAGLAIKIDV
jgi:hypothetical protein